jgi:superoxide dismutase, Cu-Zn family
MKAVKLAIGLGVALALGYAGLASHGNHTNVLYADAVGNPKTPKVRGSMVFVTLPNGDHEVFVRVSGLEPNSGVYANHVHFSNQILDSSCEGQNGEDAIPLRNIVADARGTAMGYTFFAAQELPNLPKGKLYFNVHSNKPQPVGEYIACGNVGVLNSGTPQ